MRNDSGYRVRRRDERNENTRVRSLALAYGILGTPIVSILFHVSFGCSSPHSSSATFITHTLHIYLWTSIACNVHVVRGSFAGSLHCMGIGYSAFFYRGVCMTDSCGPSPFTSFRLQVRTVACVSVISLYSPYHTCSGGRSVC
ncbi:hypothetical protein K504DRAFT_67726 [Pleomassaria siparia CBS 279.74]|uniref:Uncharacterized protein n=1 Tax=Pleomassaria siparia CBS 279.74 TaxID=1314801 RepID=A0A6G1K1T5_9PLEO|nr:hypothetical protein K504DRAFT_67726 [Pleomassaria siparia CBS 279.74]